MNASATLRIAIAQMTSGPDRQANLDAVLRAMDEAEAQGAAWVLTPETCNVMDEDFERVLKDTRHEAEDPFINRLKEEAKARGMWVLIGSAVVKPDETGLPNLPSGQDCAAISGGAQSHPVASLQTPDNRLANRSLLINHKGEVAARYDKLHLFDATVGDGVGRYHESARYRPGEAPVLAETPWGKLGMSVCYDLRFPYLYSYYAQAGADFLAVPAAFTQKTGAAHWHVLLRARAIENGCFVIAPAQTGKHSEKRFTYGHSLVVNPWGEVLADGGEHAHTMIAELPLKALEEARGALPCLTHHRALG
ncbi:carbon-nitrogen hydrolase family protein [bacterium]|nr:carbon-nitrogen hydrolase family protein [bacterium]